MTSNDELRRLLADTQRFYRRRLYDSWVYEYLSSRYLAGAITPAQIGYAPPGQQTTTNWLLKQGYTPDQIIAAGVAVNTDQGLRDVLHDRLTIPISDAQSVIAWTARCRPESDLAAKYKNTPATALFDKSATLVGLHQAIDRLRAGAIPVIVEGALDKLAIDRLRHERNANYVGLATCGTALTEHHIHALREITVTPPVFAFDADQAGQKAARRAWDLTNPYGNANLRVAQFEPGQDPASIHPKQLHTALWAAAAMSSVVAQHDLANIPRDNPVATAYRVNQLIERDLCRVHDIREYQTTLEQTAPNIPRDDLRAMMLRAAHSNIPRPVSATEATTLLAACNTQPVQAASKPSPAGPRYTQLPKDIRQPTKQISR